ncbi:RHS repeat domain-containing protein, partial [Bacillus sp. V33-4]|uniref:RHS repeat domain-containing protein n=1 Tax=Bacillus sp. V33-4 TaxID=2054169 RepID=UPI0015E0FBB5
MFISMEKIIQSIRCEVATSAFFTRNEKPDYVKKSIRKAKYQYDEAGNRIEQNEDGKITKYRYNELNELVEAGDKKYFYDANGNLVEKETREGTIKYDYTTDNRLKGVYYPDGSQVEYEYDALRRKASRTQGYYHLSKKGNGWSWGNRDDWKDWDEWDDWGKWYNGDKNSLKKWKGKPLYEETTQYLYDGLDVFKEYGEHGQPLAQYYQGADHTIARKTFGYHGRKQEEYEGNVQSKGGLLYYHEDALGNILDVTDRSGEKRGSYSYDAFGNLFSHMAAPYNAVGFTGKSYDAKAGMIDFGSRWYSPNEGRFTTMDTFTGWKDIPASLNRYSYVHNNPLKLIDPTGRAAE